MKFAPVSHRKNRRPRRFLLQALGFACLTAAALPAARAQTAYTWNGGTGNWSNGSMWSLMMVPNDPSADVFIDGGKTGTASVVALDNSYTVGRLTVDAGDTLNTNNGTTLTVSTAAGFAGSGSIIDNGTINVNGGYYNTQVVFNGPGSLSGTGTLNLVNGSNLSVYENNSGDLLTIGAGFTVAGTGNFGNGQTTFVNRGTINANSSGNTLNLQPGGGNATFANLGAGLAQASSGGTLQLVGNNGGVFTGGTFRALDNSQVNLVNGATVSGATLATAGSGTVNNNNAATLVNVTNNGVFNANNSTTTSLTGTLTNNGTFNVNGGYYNTNVQLTGPVTLGGTGTFQLNNGSNLNVYALNSGDRLTINAGATIAGTGNLGSGQTTFLNNGLVNANSSGNTLNLQPGGGNATFANGATGLAEASGGGTLQLNGGSGGIFTGGTFQALDGSALVLTNGATVSGAILTTAGTGTLTNVNNATLANATTNGAFTANNGTATFLTGTLTNNSTFTAVGGYYNTNVQLTGPVTLAGTGTLNLGGGGANLSLYAQNSGDRLTINAGATITGAGNLGNGQTTFTNRGLVNANSSGNTLNLQPGGTTASGTDFTNGGGGLAEATGGGILQLNGGSNGVFTGGTFQALDTSTVNLVNGANVVGATLTTAGSGTVNVFNSTLTNVTNNGSLVTPNGYTQYLTGTLTNNGTDTIVGGYYNTYGQLTGPVTLAGTGTLNLGGAGSNLALYAQNPGDRLTINAGATITGAGNLGAGQTTFTNKGLVNANSNGNTLTIQPGGGTADFTNSGAGLAEASGGGTLQLNGGSGGVFTGGTFQALDGSALVLTNSANVSGAILTTAGSGTVSNVNSATLTNVTNNGTFIANNSTATYLTGTLTNNGTFTAVGGYYNTYVFLNSPVTLAGTGTLNLGNGGGNLSLYALNPGDRLTINAGATLAGAGNLGAGQTTFLNNGTVNANTSGSTLTVQPGGGAATFVNGATGLVEATGGGTANLINNSGGTFTNNGTFEALSGSTGGSSTLNVSSGALTNDSGTTLTGGTYKVIATDSSATSTLSFGGGTIVTNAAKVTLSGASTVFTEINSLAANSGSFAVANGRNFTTAGALANSGTLVAAGSTLSVTGKLTQTSAGTLAGAGTFAATGGFTLSGNINPGGTVNPATGAFTGGAGTTNLNGDAAFDVNTKFNFELGSITGTNDHLNVTGALNLNGTLNVTALAGFGTGTYDLIDHPITSIVLSGLTLGTLPSGYTYTVLYAPNQVDLVVVQNVVPEPGTWAFVLGGATLLLGAQRFRRQS